MQPVAAGLQLRDIGIAVGVVDELVMGDVLQAIVLRRAEQREHAEPVGDEIVESRLLKQNVVRRLVSQPGELMLPGADEHDGERA